MKGTILGLEVNSYTKDGVLKVGRTAYVVWDKPKNPPDGLKGRKCEALFAPFDFPKDVDVDMHCDFEYEVQQTRKGAMARLIDITPIEPMIVEITPLE